MHGLETRLRQGLADLKLALNDAQIVKLLDYLDLIEKWGKVYNLTAVRDPVQMLTHHLLDCLAVIAPLHQQIDCMLEREAPEAERVVHAEIPMVRLLDVGSGAGLPGVVIAICCPDIAVDCVDPVAKKVAFIRQVAATMGLSNLRGLHARVESLTDKYSVISSRAFASLTDFTHWSLATLAEKGIWLAMKGRCPTDEITALPENIAAFHVEQLTVPGLDAERCIVWMRKT